MKKLDILIVGVGGQGVILASDILAEVGMVLGYDIKKSDILGLAVRGGSVMSQVRWGNEVASPVVMPGEVDFLLGFEPLEALRVIDYLAPESIVIVNTYPIPPVSVSSGDASYPSLEEIKHILKSGSGQTYFLDATGVAMKLGTARLANMVLLGAFAAQLNVAFDVWENVIKNRVPATYRDLNLRAFQAGRALVQGGVR
jgi:indolepyruvate ferredoxin oxidoreductase beta subunit